MAKKATTLAAIDGADTRTAPKPRRGLLLAVYDTVDAIGFSDVSRIKKYLPAAITDAAQVVSTKKLEKTLYSAVYHGYLIKSEGRYRVAPRSYYDARQAIIAEQKANPQRRRKRGDEAPPDDVPLVLVRPFWHWAILTLTATVAALSGFIAGALVV